MLQLRHVRILVALLVVFSGTGLLLAGQAPASQRPYTTAELAQKLPTDPDTTVGTFPNGLRYYVRKNALPEKRAELRLVVNAGSNLEEDDQQGLAHFVEHMAFNGTKNFPKGDIVSFMESIGMRFGPSVNAFTSFDETVYILQIPTNKSDVIDRSLQVLEDWAHNVTFDPVEVDKERGVITEEWRLGRGASARMQEQTFPLLLKGSRYAERLPIGKMDVIQNFKQDRLKKFYTDWYRPDLMGVIAVGDFDKSDMEALIKKHFASIPAAVNPKPRPIFDVPKQPGTLYGIASDPESPNATVQVYSKMPFRDPSTVGAYRQQIAERLFGSMLSERLGEMAQKPESPFIAAGSGRQFFVKSSEATVLSALSKEDAITKTIEALFAEVERVNRFGFTATELEREKASYQRAVDQLMTEIQKRPSGRLADELVRNFTQAEPFPGLANEAEITRRVMPTISLNEVNSLAKEWLPEGNRVLLITAPKKANVIVPDEATIAETIKAASGKTLTAYADNATTKPLFSATLKPGTITKTNVRADIGITEWQLSNGVRVVMKPTTFKEDEVRFEAFSPGGTSLVEDSELISAQPAASLVENSGLGSFGPIELRKLLTDKIANVNPYIGDLDEGISGGASVKDLETMFQMIYMSFVEPRMDPEVFTLLKSQVRTTLGSMRSQPMFLFEQANLEALTQNNPRVRTPTPEMIDTLDMNKAFGFYKDRFADASDFTFVFVGTVDPVVMKPLVEKYLGSLPSTNRKESWKDRKIETPATVVERRVEKGLEPQSHTRITFNGPFNYTLEQRTATRAAAFVLQTRLREVLREQLGGTYSVSASASFDKVPQPEYQLVVDFGSNPDRTEELVKRVFAEIEAFKKSGPTPGQLSDVKETFTRDFETNIKTNEYVLAQIAQTYEYGQPSDLAVLFDMPAQYRKLTASAIQDAAKKYMDTSRYVKVSLFPEKR